MIKNLAHFSSTLEGRPVYLSYSYDTQSSKSNKNYLTS